MAPPWGRHTRDRAVDAGAETREQGGKDAGRGLRPVQGTNTFCLCPASTATRAGAPASARRFWGRAGR